MSEESVGRASGLPADYGDTAAEHAALVESVGLLDEEDRRVIRVIGEHARRMVNGLVSNHLGPLDEGRAVYTFVLTPKGRPVAEGRVLPAAEGVWLDVPAASLEGLLEHLRKYLPPIYATFELLPSVRRLGLLGPRAGAALLRAAPALGWPDLSPESLAPLELKEGPEAGAEGLPRLVRREPAEGEGFDLYVAADALPEWRRVLLTAVEAEGGRAVGRRAREIRRVELGIPAYGAEIDLEVLPQETGQQERALSVEKGCYTGQEVVARIHYRGRVNRHLRGLQFESLAAPPPTGTELFREGRSVGRLTSVGTSPGLGPIALGYVRREVNPGERLATTVEAPPTARVIELPFTLE